MTEPLREIIHYPGSLDEVRDGITESGDVVPLDQEPEPPTPLVESDDEQEDIPESDRDIKGEIARPALGLVSTATEEDLFIEREEKKGKTFTEAQEMWDQRRNR